MSKLYQIVLYEGFYFYKIIIKILSYLFRVNGPYDYKIKSPLALYVMNLGD